MSSSPLEIEARRRMPIKRKIRYIANRPTARLTASTHRTYIFIGSGTWFSIGFRRSRPGRSRAAGRDGAATKPPSRSLAAHDEDRASIVGIPAQARRSVHPVLSLPIGAGRPSSWATLQESGCCSNTIIAGATGRTAGARERGRRRPRAVPFQGAPCMGNLECAVVI